MNLLPVAGAIALVACLSTAPAMAATRVELPMDSFNNAFYTCDDGGAFLMSYDSNEPKEATMTTSNNSKHYTLKKAKVADGVQFSDQKVKFWTDGKTVVVEGTEVPLNHCKPKAG
jgi:membrane-bound inhibitor of C-type lysozyme